MYLKIMMNTQSNILKFSHIVDSERNPINTIFQESFDFIDESLNNNKGILVHCNHGMSRSVTVVVAYLMKKFRVGYKKALEYVKEQRPLARPNQGFINQLMDYEDDLLL